jgi:threonine dehydratase
MAWDAPYQRSVCWNTAAQSRRSPASAPDLASDLAGVFHRKLPGYAPTSLISLQPLAEEIGVGAVHMKYEGGRLGLSSFKILGASWGSFRAVTQRYGLPLDSDVDTVKSALAAAPTPLLAATDGNHGIAVARVGRRILGVPVRIFVPQGLHPSTIQRIWDEGATVTEVAGSYSEAVRFAFAAAGKTGEILFQDTAFPGYEEIAMVSSSSCSWKSSWLPARN